MSGMFQHDPVVMHSRVSEKWDHSENFWGWEVEEERGAKNTYRLYESRASLLLDRAKSRWWWGNDCWDGEGDELAVDDEEVAEVVVIVLLLLLEYGCV